MVLIAEITDDAPNEEEEPEERAELEEKEEVEGWSSVEPQEPTESAAVASQVKGEHPAAQAVENSNTFPDASSSGQTLNNEYAMRVAYIMHSYLYLRNAAAAAAAAAAVAAETLQAPLIYKNSDGSTRKRKRGPYKKRDRKLGGEAEASVKKDGDAAGMLEVQSSTEKGGVVGDDRGAEVQSGAPAIEVASEEKNSCQKAPAPVVQSGSVDVGKDGAQSRLLRELGIRVSQYTHEERRDVILKHSMKRNNRQVGERPNKVPSGQASAERHQRGVGGRFLNTNELQYTHDPGHLIYEDSSNGEHCSTDSEPQPTTLHLSPISDQAPPMTKKSRTGNFTVDEDKLLISAWLNVSLDAVIGNEQKHKQYWYRIWDFFHKYKTFESDRSQNSLMHRWSTIQLATNKFCVCYTQIEATQQSEVNEYDKIGQAKTMYRSMHKATFQYEHCWTDLRYQPKWIENCQKKKPAKKVRTTASPATSSPSTPETINLGEDGGFEDIARPPSRKAEKEGLSKRKGEGRADEEGSGANIADLLKEMREEKKQMTAKKMELYDKTFQQEQERLAYEHEKLRQKQQAEDERIMLIDTSGMPPLQREYYHRRQMEILHRGFPGP